MVEEYKVITLCGSTRFKDEFLEAQKRLTLEGNIVISVGLFGHSGDNEVWENMDEGTLTKTKEMLDDMHKRKIDMADEIYVINVGGYIGESTKSEIEYAKATGKPVRYLEDERIQRIRYYEGLLREATTVLDNPDNKENIKRLVQCVSELSEYYGSQTWKEDFAADEAGELPPDLERGILSEDGIYNVLERYREMTYPTHTPHIRPILPDEIPLLKDFLYEAIFIPEGAEAPGRDIVEQPELRVYTDDFGSREGDHCLVAEQDGQVVGAVWSRIMDDYGHVDNDTPSLAISLYPEYRGRGIGTRLMTEMLALLKQQGYRRASLAVQRANRAVRMYERVGFRTVDENDEEYIMVCDI